MMRSIQLIKRNLTHYWQTNLVVVFGVGIAVAVLGGALLVGDSVRGSLRELFLQRVGNTDLVISGTSFFREELAADIQNDPRFSAAGFSATCPIITIDGSATLESNHRVASGIRVYGVDERFWSFHGSKVPTANNREVFISQSLADDIDASAGDGLLLQVQKPSGVPAESLHSKKQDLGRVLRVTIGKIISPQDLGEFSIQPQQTGTLAVFMPLRLLQTELEQEGRSNVVLVAHRQQGAAQLNSQTETDALNKILNDTATLDDYGIQVRDLGQPNGISIEHESKLLSDRLAITATKAATDLSFRVVPVLSYLANSISVADEAGVRSIPYSLVTAVDDAKFVELNGQNGASRLREIEAAGRIPIVLNDWAAHDLKALKFLTSCLSEILLPIAISYRIIPG
jgi:hypothetical protein